MNVFQFSDYRAYLHKKLGEGQRNGLRQRLAELLNCQAAHLSQVLNGKNHLSIEHAFGVNTFFSHSEKESDYFLTIVQAGRAGTIEARDYFQKRAQKIKEQSLKVQDRISSKKRELSKEEQATYYGDGLYALVHVAASLPQLKTISDLSKYLNVEPDILGKIIEFLLQTGLITKKGEQFSTGPGHTHLGSDSPHIKKHHVNLRLNALHRIERGIKKTNLHYASYYSLSKQDAFSLKQKILNLIDENLKIIGPSKEETIYCNVIDFYEISE